MKKIIVPVLLTIFLFSACYNEFDLGLDILPEGDLTQLKSFDTVTVLGKTVLSEHVRTSMPQYLFLGRYEDPIFGTTEAGFIAQMYLIDYPGFPDDIVLDSICISMKLPEGEDDVYYGNPFSPVKVKVYRITDSLSASDPYYSDFQPDVNSYTLVGDNNLYYNPSDSTVSIRLSDEFGQYLIDNEDEIFYSYGTFFHQIIRGFYFEPYEGNGAIFKIEANKDRYHSKFKLIMYYHTESRPDTQYVFDEVQVNQLSVKFNLFKHDYTNAVFYDQLQSDDFNNENTYLQGLAGTKVELKFPYVQNLKNSNIAITKAEIVFKVPKESIGTFEPVPEIGIMGKDTAGVEIFFQDFIEPVSNKYTGAKLENYNEYRLNVTRFVEGLISGAYDDLHIYLVDVNTSSDFKRSVISTSLNQETPLKLVIFYTDLPN